MHVTNGLVLIIVEEAFMTEFASIIERSGGQDPGIELPQSARGGYRKWLRYAEPNATNIFRCQFQNLHILQAKAAIKAQRPSPPPRYHQDEIQATLRQSNRSRSTKGKWP
jgi:hypothetical protein